MEEGRVGEMASFIRKYLDSFEGVFDSDESFWSYEHMEDYIRAANWMDINFQRSENRVREVQEVMGKLPF
jgi:hypothetical protein